MLTHTPVMPKEVIKYLAPRSNENFIDATCGLGGHAAAILENSRPDGKLLAIDQDAIALAEAGNNLSAFGDRVTFVQANFADLGLLVQDWPVSEINGILFDLGVSTYQLMSPERGFSVNQEARLDMRMSPDRQRITAEKIVNSWDEHSIKKILKEYGEEPFAGPIAKAIVRQRAIRPVEKTNELVDVIKQALPPQYRAKLEKHFATATFRALRMAVNDELKVLESALKQAVQVLSPGGRMVVISFHSLEDRIVKNFLRDNPNLEVITSKPIMASPEEVIANSKARSAKLRAARKI